MDKRLRILTDSGRIPHALVIDGGTYEERLSAAKEISAALICTEENASSRPCGLCAACKKAENEIHPDIITVLPEDKKKTISVEVIRKMRDDAYIVPNEGNRKVYIIAKAELMQDYSQNALLKILEEPPEYANFILLCTSRSVLLPTVLSRTAVFGLNEDSDASAGNRDEALEQASSVARLLARKDELGIIQAAAFFDKNYDMLPLTLDCLTLIIRDALVLRSGGKELLGGAPDAAAALAKTFSEEKLFAVAEAVADLIRATDIYGNKNLTITRLSSCLLSAAEK